MRLSTSPTPNTLSLVGSYSESLLTGRMSTTPSRPFPFQVDLGVLGQLGGEIPRHLLVDFEARFYALPEGPTTTRATTSAHSFARSCTTASTLLPPSPPPQSSSPNLSTAPYVGTIDIDAHYQSMLDYRMQALFDLQPGDPLPPSPPLFPGYQIPAHGQVQLLVKSPHLNTPVKLFLVPYDLRDMPAGTRTFIRQKICVEAVVPLPPHRNKRHSVGAMTTTANSSSNNMPSPATPRETLKYAVHVQFVALSEDDLRIKKPADGVQSPPRYYIHKSIRVVFSPHPPEKEGVIIKTYLETPAGLRRQDEELDAQSRLKDAQKKYMPIGGGGGSTLTTPPFAGVEWHAQRKRIVQMRKDLRRSRQSGGNGGGGSNSRGALHEQEPRAGVNSESIGVRSGRDQWSGHPHAIDIPASSSMVAQDVSFVSDGGGGDDSMESIANSDPDGERWGGVSTEAVLPGSQVDDLAASMEQIHLSSPSSTHPPPPYWSNLHASRPGTPVATAASAATASAAAAPLHPHHATMPTSRQRSRTITPLSFWRARREESPAGRNTRNDDAAASAAAASPTLSTSSPTTSRPTSPFALNAPIALTEMVKRSVNGTMMRSRTDGVQRRGGDSSSRDEGRRDAQEQQQEAGSGSGTGSIDSERRRPSLGLRRRTDGGERGSCAPGDGGLAS